MASIKITNNTNTEIYVLPYLLGGYRAADFLANAAEFAVGVGELKTAVEGAEIAIELPGAIETLEDLPKIVKALRALNKIRKKAKKVNEKLEKLLKLFRTISITVPVGNTKDIRDESVLQEFTTPSGIVGLLGAKTVRIVIMTETGGKHVQFDSGDADEWVAEVPTVYNKNHDGVYTWHEETEPGDMLDAQMGTPLWSKSHSNWPKWGNDYGRYVSSHVIGNSLYATTPGYLYHLDKATGRELSPMRRFPTGLDYADIRLTGDHQHHLVAGTWGIISSISFTDLQKLNWTNNLEGSGYTASVNSILVNLPGESQPVLFVGHNGWVYRIDPANGKAVRSNSLPNWGHFEVLLASDGNKLLVGSNGRVTMLQVDDIKKQWGRWPKSAEQARPLGNRRTHVICHGDMVYASCSYNVFRFDPDSGKAIWLRNFTSDAVELRLATDDVRLFAAAPGGRIQAWDKVTGEKVWDANLKTRPQSPTTMLLANGQLYVASAHMLAVFDRATGRQLQIQRVPDLWDPLGPAAVQEIRMTTDGASLYLGGNLLTVAMPLS